MKSSFLSAATNAARPFLLAASLAVSVSVSAAPTFTFDPSAASLAGTSFTADNILISDYASITESGPSFTETGYLSVTGFQLGGTTFQPTGLNSTYGLYIEFTAQGTTTASVGSLYGGNFTSLTYTLYGYNGTGTFSPTSAPTPTVTLGTGSLISGEFYGSRTGSNVTSATADAMVSFSASTAPEASGFFVSPTTFFSSAQATFTNNSSQIDNSPLNGFTVQKGAGTLSFVAAPVPEPETYALLLAGLGVIGTIALRRNRAKKSD